MALWSRFAAEDTWLCKLSSVQSTSCEEISKQRKLVWNLNIVLFLLQRRAPYGCHSTKFLINFWKFVDIFLTTFRMAFVSTGQSKCKNFEWQSCQAPRLRSDNWHLRFPQFLQFDLLVSMEAIRKLSSGNGRELLTVIRKSRCLTHRNSVDIFLEMIPCTLVYSLSYISTVVKLNYSGHKAWSKNMSPVRQGLVLHLIGWVGGARFLNQSQNIVINSKSKTGLLSALDINPL